MNATVLAATSPPSPHHAFGGGVLILAVLVIVALGYGATRVTRGRRSGGHQPEPPWPSGRPAPPPAGPPAGPSAGPPPEERTTAPRTTAPPAPAPAAAPARPPRATVPPDPKDGWAVQTRGLTKRFGSNVAVDDVELRVPRGSAFGYLGPNGAGKTTLIRTLLGLTRASAGTMSLLGIPVPAERRRALARVGAIVDEPRFLLAAARGGDAGERIAPSLARVGMADRAEDKVATYSMGMRQRLGVAACLLADPELLILDEPMNGLDPAGMHEMRAMIASLADEGRTVVLSSHLLDEVERTCDAVAIVDHGRVIRQGPIDELIRGAGAMVVQVDCAEPARAKQLIDEAGIAAGTALAHTGLTVTLPAGASRQAVADLNRRLVGAGIEVYGLREVQTSLEDWFLSVTSRLGEAS
jgi:ABC-2 type transport system ATP-binding protein